jgi:hypothetical protein
MFCRHHRQSVVHIPELRIQARKGSCWSSAVGLGLCVQCRLCILGDWYGSTIDLNEAEHEIASSDHTARLWEMASGESVRQYNGHHKGADDWLPFPYAHLIFIKAAVCCALHDGAS